MSVQFQSERLLILTREQEALRLSSIETLKQQHLAVVEQTNADWQLKISQINEDSVRVGGIVSFCFVCVFTQISARLVTQ